MIKGKSGGGQYSESPPMTTKPVSVVTRAITLAWMVKGLHSEKTPVSIVGVEVKKQGVNILSEGGPASTPQTPVPATPNEADAVARAVNTEQVTHKSLNTPIKLTTVTLEGV